MKKITMRQFENAIKDVNRETPIGLLSKVHQQLINDKISEFAEANGVDNDNIDMNIYLHSESYNSYVCLFRSGIPKYYCYEIPANTTTTNN